MARCSARSKATGEQCSNHAVNGSDKCRMHGGKSLRGVRSRVLKSGKYSKVLPDRLLARYAEAGNDPELLSCREELKVLDARLSDVLRRVDTGEAGELWSKAKVSFNNFKEALAQKDSDQMAIAMREFNDILNKGHTDWLAWREVTNLIAQREKIAASEQKRIINAKQFVTMEQHALLMGAVYQSVKEVVSDQEQLRAIGYKLSQLLNRSVPALDSSKS